MYHFSRLPIPLFSGYRCIHTKIEDVVTQLNLERPCIGLLRERDSALPFLHRLGIQSPLEIKFPLTFFPDKLLYTPLECLLVKSYLVYLVISQCAIFLQRTVTKNKSKL